MKRGVLGAAAAGVLTVATVAAVAWPDDAPRGGTSLAPVDETVVVGRVIDGDTFVARDGRRVRLLVADSCERNTPGGPRATAQARELLEGRTVTLTRGRVVVDRYDRLLRYVRLPDGRDFAEVMLVGDHTAVYSGRSDASPERLAAGRAIDTNGRDCSR